MGSTTVSDERLVERARCSSEDAFAELVQRYSPMLQQQAAHFCHMRTDLEDLKQEGLLGLLSAVYTYRSEESSFRTYAAVCVRRRMISAVRRVGQNRMLLGEEADLAQECAVPFSGREADPAALVVEREEAARLYQQLHTQLTPLEYDVLLLHAGGYTYEEIAGRQGVSTKSVDNALQRVRRKWRKTEA